jgi:hypothetical protein
MLALLDSSPPDALAAKVEEAMAQLRQHGVLS